MPRMARCLAVPVPDGLMRRHTPCLPIRPPDVRRGTAIRFSGLPVPHLMLRSPQARAAINS